MSVPLNIGFLFKSWSTISCNPILLVGEDECSEYTALPPPHDVYLSLPVCYLHRGELLGRDFSGLRPVTRQALINRTKRVIVCNWTLCTCISLDWRAATGSTDWTSLTLSREALSCMKTARAWPQRAISSVVLHTFPLPASLSSSMTPHIFWSGNHTALPLNVGSWHLYETQQMRTPGKHTGTLPTKQAAP